jgi:hypothetical protein
MPGNEATFVGWNGICNDNAPNCSFTLDSDTTVQARFDMNWTLTVVTDGPGSGTVISTTPSNVINCGSDCSEVVSDGTTVTLSASSTGGDIFYGWSGGGCTGTGLCTTTVTAATTVTARFDKCVRNTQTCSNNQFMQCDATGQYVSHVIPNGGAGGTPSTITYDGTYVCPLGCHATLPRCGDIDASNGLNAALDDGATSAAGLDLPSDLSPRTIKSIDTSNYNPISGVSIVTLDNDTPYSVPAQVITQAPTGAPEILVLKLRTFSIPQGTTVTVTGSRALAIVSQFDIYLAGTLDISGPTGSAQGGGPGRVTTAGCVGTYVSPASGGGGYYAIGGASSTGGAGGSGDFDTRIYMIPLGGGCGGGTGGGVGGGPAGGVVQLVSRTQIVFASTALINASGGGGYATCSTIGCTSYRATGGGAGGGVSMEAPVISFAAGALVAGRGGNGAASNSGTTGANGPAGTTTGSSNSTGVTCSGCGTGGVGGTETTLAGSAGTGTAPAIAGGGGGVGRCLTRNRTGSVTVPSGTMKIGYQAFTLPAAR